jgi:solute carrier family 25 carnitine/acylcarnitine transporter 20/29
MVYSATPDRKSQALTIPELAFAGFFSAIPATLVAGPAERVKVLLQVRP